VHGMAHVPALDAWSHVLRGNVLGHHLRGCECVGPTRTSGPLRGGVCNIRSSLKFHAHVNKMLWGDLVLP
jgi:hypothetical protein